MSLDEKRGIVYVILGSPTYDMYGADRIAPPGSKETNLFGNSVVALDARTGKRLWHFQTVHHDLWDYDLCAAPQLITIRHDGRDVDAPSHEERVLFVFNRVTGGPIWPIEERPVQSDVPGEQMADAALPDRAPPDVRSSRSTISYFLSPQQRAEWKERSQGSNEGMFTPPKFLGETIQMPGLRGQQLHGLKPLEGPRCVLNQDWPSITGTRAPK
jgi:quinoprotein glucose dehydrogenase